MPDFSLKNSSKLTSLKSTGAVGMLTAIRITVVTLLLTGVMYPLFILGFGQLIFSFQAEGSLVDAQGHPKIDDKLGAVVGSELLGQQFTRPEYFFSRPSLDNYQTTGVMGGPLDRYSISDLNSQRTIANLLKNNNASQTRDIPLTLVSPSCSGVDPHIDKDSALWQIPRIVKARLGIKNKDPRSIEHIITRLIDAQCGGTGMCNVLSLNLSLDRKFGPPIRKEKL